MDQFKLKMYPLIDIEDVFALRDAGLIGSRLKPGLLSSYVIAVRGDAGTGAFAVRLQDTITVRPTAPTTIPDQFIDDVMRGVAHTLFANKPVEISREPMYTAAEVGRE